jgi:uncharacterized membrane protein YdjX (TVP38/TMEM64 family)
MTALQEMVVTNPLRAMLLFVLIRSMSVIWPPLPGFPFDILAVCLFGLARGLLLGEAGVMLGAVVAFAIARRVRASLGVGRSLTLRRLEAWLSGAGWLSNDAEPRRQFHQWFVLRLVTNPLFDPISYVAGLTEARTGPYLLGSFLGNMPSMFLFYVLEDEVARVAQNWSIVVTVAFLVTVIWLAHHVLAAPRPRDLRMF